MNLFFRELNHLSLRFYSPVHDVDINWQNESVNRNEDISEKNNHQ